MTEETPDQGRAKLSFDLDEDDSSSESIDHKIQQISKKSGFTARAVPTEDLGPIQKRARHRAKTGRTYPFNTKVRPETYEKICALADAATIREGRPISLAEIIERALKSLEEKSHSSQ